MYKEKFFTEELENTVEEELFKVLYEIIQSGDVEFCTCRICVQDIAAIVLNQLEPRYKNSLMDKLYPNAAEREQLAALDSKIRDMILIAIEKVSQHPHH